jgi:hypothetical protein
MLVFVNFGGGRYWWLGPLFGIGVSLVSSLVQEVRGGKQRTPDADARPAQPFRYLGTDALCSLQATVSLKAAVYEVVRVAALCFLRLTPRPSHAR